LLTLVKGYKVRYSVELGLGKKLIEKILEWPLRCFGFLIFASQSMNRIWYGVELMIQGNRRGEEREKYYNARTLYTVPRVGFSICSLGGLQISGKSPTSLRLCWAALLQGKSAHSARLNISLSHSLQIFLSYSTKRQAEHPIFAFSVHLAFLFATLDSVISPSKPLFSLWIYRFRGSPHALDHRPPFKPWWRSHTAFFLSRLYFLFQNLQNVEANFNSYWYVIDEVGRRLNTCILAATAISTHGRHRRLPKIWRRNINQRQALSTSGENFTFYLLWSDPDF
jgi:hypothetical protein